MPTLGGQSCKNCIAGACPARNGKGACAKATGRANSLPGTVRRHRGESPRLPGAFPPWIRAAKPRQTAYPELFAVIGAKVPDYRGLFLRGYGQQSHSQNNGSTVGVTSTTHKSGALGEVQGDAIRNIYGKFSTETPSREMSDLFTQYDGPGDGNGDDGWSADPRIIFDASRVVPTATENRPVNTAVRYFIRAR